MNNLLALENWERLVIDPDQVPDYPTYDLSCALGGETTFDLVMEAGKPSETVKRLAVSGELLRDSDFRFIPDHTRNIEYRALVRVRAERDEKMRPFYWECCRSSILYFINTFCWTYDPRMRDPHIPFVTYPFQDDLLTWCIWLVKNKESGLIEKSRDMGATWCMEALALYMTLFHPGQVEYQLSLREEDVDSRSEDSLFGKLRYMLRNLPTWMQGGWVEKEQGIDNKMSLRFPSNDSGIRGQLTGGTSGRSGRASRAFYDEFAFVDDSEKVLKAAGSLSPSCLFLSTPNGMGNMFYQMASDPRVRKKTLHWTLHPLKNELWMKKERSKVQYTEEIWAQEHDINYAQSTQERVYKQFINYTASAYDWSHPQSDPYFQYDPNFDVFVFMDFGINDPTSCVFAQLRPTPIPFHIYCQETLVLFDFFETNNWTVDRWAGFLKGKVYRYREIVGDYRTGNQRDATGNTWIKYLSQHGIRVTGKYNTEFGPITEVKRLLEKPGALAIMEEKCGFLVQAFQNWSFPIDSKTGQVSPGSKPKHDQWSHCMKAVAYGVDYLYGQSKKPKERNDFAWDFDVLKSGYI